MQLTHRQKVMLGVLAAATGAWAIDALLPGPASASAASESIATGSQMADAATAPASLQRVADAGADRVSGPRHERVMEVVGRLRRLDESIHASSAAPDVFAMRTASSVPTAEQIRPDPDAGEATPPPVGAHSASAPPALRISGIVSSHDGPMALIDGALRREGDMVSGWRIERIRERSLVISLSGRVEEIRMDP